MPSLPWTRLSRRERQIMDALFRLGEASAADVQTQIPDPPSYSAVRSTLAILVDKGHLTFTREGRSYIYRPAASPSEARGDAARGVLATFFRGSVPLAVSELLSAPERALSDEELDEIAALVERARHTRPSRPDDAPTNTDV